MNHEFSPTNIKEDEFYKRFRGFVEVKYGCRQTPSLETGAPINSGEVLPQSDFKAPAPAEIVLAYPHV